VKVLVWPVAMYGCEKWALRNNKETRLDTFKIKGLRKMLLVRGEQRKQMSGFLTKLE